MTQTHEAIEELLAGYVLRSLSGEDAAEAERLLTEHVPTCATCRDALAGFQRVAGDLAFEAEPIDPPELLLPRIHRELDVPERRRRPRVFIVGAAASILAVVGMAGIAINQGMRASNAQDRADLVTEAFDASRAPGARVVNVGPMTEISQPGVESIYLYGRGVPDPAPGMVYRVWLGNTDGTFTFAKDVRPEDGIVIVHLTIDPTRVDRIVITEEPEGTPAALPGNVRWDSASAA
jgi:hypothetical protein